MIIGGKIDFDKKVIFGLYDKEKPFKTIKEISNSLIRAEKKDGQDFFQKIIDYSKNNLTDLQKIYLKIDEKNQESFFNRVSLAKATQNLKGILIKEIGCFGIYGVCYNSFEYYEENINRFFENTFIERKYNQNFIFLKQTHIHNNKYKKPKKAFESKEEFKKFFYNDILGFDY